MRSESGSHRHNAILAWAAVVLLLVTGTVFAASGAILWTLVAIALAGVPLVPALIHGNWRAMPPWGLPAITVLPFLLRPYPLLSQTVAYLAVAAVALMVAIYLTAFTDVEMTAQFAIAFVALTTIAVGTVWAGARGMADLYLGTSTLGGLGGLQRDLLLTVAGGVLASAVFEGYLRERYHGGLRGVPVQEA
jgi:hypothetical protein